MFAKKNLRFGRVYDGRKEEKKEKQRMTISVDKLNHSSDGCTNGKLTEDQVRDRLFWTKSIHSMWSL